ncbi:MarR family winged helix-turn-helix transcriptional regulator [Ancylobacter terrae]|uniref:MarR family winged helix-turn-helix transcriptional regulator n=1 Tax=Ancylobacter sp. sgz301288 TaxID=3342077 RepID=UPI00385EC91F
MSTDPLDLDRFLCFAVYSASHAFNRAYKPLLDKLGLTYPQYLVMVSLWAQDGQTVGSLGARLFLESSTLTPLLKRLEASGLVSRMRNPADERQVRLFLTDAGRALRDQAETIPGCIFEAIGQDADTIGQLKAAIDRLRNSLASQGGE